jgi:hypothetical protein
MAGGKKKKGDMFSTIIVGAILIGMVMVGIGYVVVPQVGKYIDLGGDTYNTGGGGTGTADIADNLWDARGQIGVHAPDINITIEDARFSSTEGATNPTTDNIYIYWFTENPLTLTPADTYYSNYDRLEYLVSDGRYLMGSSAVDWGAVIRKLLTHPY